MRSTKQILDCGKRLDIAQLESWYLQSLKALLSGQPVRIEVSQLQKIDTAALQLLYQFYQQALQDGIEVEWSEMSESFREAVSLSGLSFTADRQVLRE